MSLAIAGNRNSTETITWRTEPATRGTWSILSVCIITTSLCVWTAVHLNVPPPDQKHAQFWRKFYWVGIGLFAPEMVAYCAWYQRLATAKGFKDIQKAIGQNDNKSWPKKCLHRFQQRGKSKAGDDEKSDRSESPEASPLLRNEWTMTHAFYTYMGGFEIDSGDTDSPMLPPGKDRMRLTLKGVALALNGRPDFLKDFTADAILDKSKASPIAKAIVCSQALWFCLQCLERLISSTPLSLLELNTFVHCIFALVIYIQWWDKPLDVATPTVLRGENVRGLLAWLSMYRPMNELGISKESRCEARRIRVVDKADPYFGSISSSRIRPRDAAKDTRDTVPETSRRPEGCIALMDCDELLSTGLCFYDEGEASRSDHSWFVILTPQDIERWKCAAPWFKANPPSGIWSYSEHDDVLNPYTPDWPPLLLNRRAAFDTSTWTLFICAGLVYGGLHALPWNSEFRTVHEKVMWQISVTIIAGLGPMALAAILAAYLARVVVDFVRKSQQIPQPSEAKDSISCMSFLKESKSYRIFKSFAAKPGLYKVLCSKSALRAVGFLAVGVVCLGYVLARVFIVVECIVALFHSEPGVFEVPSWTAYFPHIS